jgi:hypothetical protein
MEYRIIGLKDIAFIKELWERLNVHHLEKSPDFKEIIPARLSSRGSQIY